MYQVNAVESTGRSGRLAGIRGRLAGRSTAAASALLVGVVAGAVLFAAPAQAHKTAVTGDAVCLTASGQWQVIWTLTNDWGKDAKVKDFVSDPAVTAPATIPAKDKVTITYTYPAGVTDKTATISFTAQWGEPGTKEGFYEDKENRASKDIKGPCNGPTPTPTVVTPTPTVPVATTPRVPAAPQLPVTGSRSWMLAAGGAAVLVIGVALVVLVPRRRRA